MILFEMTRDYAIILPTLTAVVVSTAVAQAITRDTIYTLKLRRRGIEIHEEAVRPVLATISVGGSHGSPGAGGAGRPPLAGGGSRLHPGPCLRPAGGR